MWAPAAGVSFGGSRGIASDSNCSFYLEYSKNYLFVVVVVVNCHKLASLRDVK